jgi:hypothetical protein
VSLPKLSCRRPLGRRIIRRCSGLREDRHPGDARIAVKGGSGRSGRVSADRASRRLRRRRRTPWRSSRARSPCAGSADLARLEPSGVRRIARLVSLLNSNRHLLLAGSTSLPEAQNLSLIYENGSWSLDSLTNSSDFRTHFSDKSLVLCPKWHYKFRT